ncbi:MAG: NUDIX domain-containing protein [Nitriliruptorales bacterium]|nr:NUDIX domain-containing protein [Nitriliruptorales bacterium]
MERPQSHAQDRDAYLAEGNARQARKRVAADVVFRDADSRILLVDPSYKPDWDVPGGMAEANESPRDAALREIREELGFQAQLGRILCVDWVSPHGPWDDSLVFVFDGGALTTEQAASLRPVDAELRSLRFVASEEAAVMLRPYAWRRIQAALTQLDTPGSTLYLEDGYST